MKNIFYTLASFALMIGAGLQSFAQPMIAITESDMVFMIPNAAAPGSISTPVAITGISAGQSVAGSDYRPNTGELIILGYNSSNGQSQLYVLNATTGQAVAISPTPIILELGTGSIAFDFNPTVDRIRVEAANGRNYRLNPVNGTIAANDGNLAYAAGDPNNSATPSVGACAYTNSYIGTEATTLYTYDEALNIITSQIPPNNGTLNTIGSSGITINSGNRTTDMDIIFDPSTGTNKAILCANTGTFTSDRLYSVNLTTGAATSIGLIGAGMAIKDIAAVIDRTLPTLAGPLLYALTKNNGNLISFDAQNPSVIRSFKSVTGITAGQTLVGLDFRPATRKMYGFGYNALTSEYQLYTIDPSTGISTIVNASPGVLALGNGPVGFDFNPAVDRIRVVSANGSNYRLNPNNGAIAATDGSLSYAATDVLSGRTPRVGSVAYSNSFNGTTATTLFGLDDSIANFVSINPPNAGILNSIHSNIRSFNLADLSTDIDFFYDSTTASNKGYMALNLVGSVNDTLYWIGTSGLMGSIGSIGYGIPIRDIAAEVKFVNAGAMVAAPTFSPPAGTYATTQMVAIATTTASATIYYTTNGNTPVPGTGFTMIYSSPVVVNDSMTLKAMATRVGFKNSLLTVGKYNIQQPGVIRTPVITPNGGTFNGQVSVSITTTTPGAEIFYTTNGNLPNLDIPNSFTHLYTGPLTRYSTGTIRAIARKSGLPNSGYAVANFVVNNADIVAAPMMNPPAGNYPSVVVVSLSTTTPDAQIYFTNSGITPSNTSPASRLYSTPFNVGNATIKAIAYKAGYQPSAVSVGIYTIGPARQSVADGEVDFYFEPADAKFTLGNATVSVYPNPSGGQINLSTFGLENGATVQIINTLGQVVFTTEIQEVQNNLDISGIAIGMYNMVVQSGSFRKVLKISRQ